MTETPLLTEIDCRARMLPAKAELVPRVAEEPTFQKTLQGWAPLIRLTREAEALIRVLAVWKMKTAFGLPWALRVSAPVIPKVPDWDL